MNSSKGDNAFFSSIADLCDAVSTIYTFIDIDESIDFFNDIKYEKVFMVIFDEVGDSIVPFFHHIPQLTAAFILSHDKAKHE